MRKAGRNALIFLVLLAACVGLFFWLIREPEPEPQPEEIVRAQLETRETKPTEPIQQEEEVPYVSPVDFEALWEQNTEIIAWLDIPDTTISYPILRSEKNNAFYLDHNAKKQEDGSGALFVEDYNSRELTDPVSIIYGHRMPNGTFFGTLQKTYENAEGFEAHRTIHLYMPEREETYRVIAAVPYSRNHILYNYDFTQAWEHYSFFDRVYMVRSISAQLDLDGYPEFGEKCLILSTCLAGNRQNRFLVIGKEISK